MCAVLRVRYFKLAIEFLRAWKSQNDPLLACHVGICIRLASRVMQPAFPLLPLALVVSAAAGLGRGLGTTASRSRAFSSARSARSTRERAPLHQLTADAAVPFAAADAFSSDITRRFCSTFLEALELTTPADLSSRWDVVSSRSGTRAAALPRCLAWTGAAQWRRSLGLQFLDRQTVE